MIQFGLLERIWYYKYLAIGKGGGEAVQFLVARMLDYIGKYGG